MAGGGLQKGVSGANLTTYGPGREAALFGVCSAREHCSSLNFPNGMLLEQEKEILHFILDVEICQP